MELKEQQKIQFKKIKEDSFYLLAEILEQSRRHGNEKDFLDALTKQVTVIRESVFEKINLFKEDIIQEIELNEAFAYFSKGLSMLKETLDTAFEVNDKEMEVGVPNDRIKLSEHPPVHIVKKLNFDEFPDLESCGDGLPFFPREDETIETSDPSKMNTLDSDDNQLKLFKEQAIVELLALIKKMGSNQLILLFLNNLLSLITNIKKPEDVNVVQKMLAGMINQNMFASDPIQAYQKKALNDLKQLLEQNLEPKDAKELYDVYSAKINAATTEDEIKQCGEEVSAETRKRMLLPASAAYKEQVINELKNLSEQNLEPDEVNELYEAYSIRISTAETVVMVNQCREEAWRDIQERAELAAALAMSLQYQ